MSVKPGQAQWIVPDNHFEHAMAAVASSLGSVGSLASLRSDPAFQQSRKRRLIFVRFAGVPLFWRIDLEIFAMSVAEDADYDADNPGTRARCEHVEYGRFGLPHRASRTNRPAQRLPKDPRRGMGVAAVGGTHQEAPLSDGLSFAEIATKPRARADVVELHRSSDRGSRPGQGVGAPDRAGSGSCAVAPALPGHAHRRAGQDRLSF